MVLYVINGNLLPVGILPQLNLERSGCFLFSFLIGPEWLRAETVAVQALPGELLQVTTMVLQWLHVFNWCIL